MMPRGVTATAYAAASCLAGALFAILVLPPAPLPILDVELAEIPGGDHQVDVRHAEVRRSASQHPRRRVVAVLVDALIEVDLVEIAEQRESVQRNTPLSALFLQVF